MKYRKLKPGKPPVPWTAAHGRRRNSNRAGYLTEAHPQLFGNPPPNFAVIIPDLHAENMMAALSPATPSHPVSRACDRCRRRKAKVGVGAAKRNPAPAKFEAAELNHHHSFQCDCPDPSSICTSCRLSGAQCTFDLPLARRGPKTKRRKPNGVVHPNSLHSPTAPPLQLSGHDSTPQGVCAAPPGPVFRDAWDTGLSVLDSALSPETVHTVQTSISDAASTRAISALQRWHDLARALSLRDPSAHLERTTNHCFELFFEYLFPLIPLVHEPSLRDGLSFFVTHTTSQSLRGNRGSNFTTDILLYGTNGLKYPELWPDVTFTLVTAVCAEAAFLLPKDIFPEGESIAELFLHASRGCLATYLEADLEYPNANSVAIRYFHSNCMHAAGKPRLSWHVFGEAIRLAQVMQMHEEESLQGLSPLDAEFRRRAFWIVYIGDKSAAILNNRPITIHQYSFESGITIGYPTGIEDENSMTPQSSGPDDATARKSFIAGFNANLRLWQTACDLLLEMRLQESRKNVDLIPCQPPTAEERHRLDHLYVLFATSLDDLPPFLQSDQLTADVNKDGNGRNSLLKLYVIQAANLYVSLHCLKMVITQKFKEFNYYTPAHNEMLLLRKTEIARDMLRVIRDAPFWSLQVNGEPCVEKVRLIGASLLEIIDQHEASPLSVRARNDLSVLLDILTRLDSKASDTLRRSL
ncbi:transcriptional regulator family: Fungal Specific TF [Penicillium sp. IBT 16267x]|nr:transcriptional regulator family: Fungal Specific TF [Penicillium sp. IBT 16267x]